MNEIPTRWPTATDHEITINLQREEIERLTAELAESRQEMARQAADYMQRIDQGTVAINGLRRELAALRSQATATDEEAMGACATELYYESSSGRDYMAILRKHFPRQPAAVETLRKITAYLDDMERHGSGNGHTYKIRKILAAHPNPPAEPAPCGKCAQLESKIKGTNELLDNAVAYRREQDVEIARLKSLVASPCVQCAELSAEVEKRQSWVKDRNIRLSHALSDNQNLLRDLARLKSAEQGERFEGFIRFPIPERGTYFTLDQVNDDQTPCTVIIRSDKPTETVAGLHQLQHLINVFPDGTASGSYPERCDMSLPYGGVVHHCKVTIGEPASPQPVAESESTPEPREAIPAGVWWDGIVNSFYRWQYGKADPCNDFFLHRWYPRRDEFPTAPPATELECEHGHNLGYCGVCSVPEPQPPAHARPAESDLTAAIDELWDLADENCGNAANVLRDEIKSAVLELQAERDKLLAERATEQEYWVAELPGQINLNYTELFSNSDEAEEACSKKDIPRRVLVRFADTGDVQHAESERDERNILE